jgi:protease secretion system outer membrane protein
MYRNLMILLFCCGFCLSAHAIGIVEIYALAQQKDPQFRASIEEKNAGEEHKAMGRAGLLPSLNLSYQNGLRNWQTAEVPQRKSLLNPKMEKVTTHRHYQSQSGSLMLTQPLFDYEAWAGYQLGVAQALMANDQWRASFMELAVRVVNSYLDLTAAQEKVVLAERQQATLQQQLDQNRRWLHAGEGTVTEIAETESRLALTAAELFTAQDEQDKARRALENLIGQPITNLAQLDKLISGPFQPIPLLPAHFKQWQQMALKENAELAAARQQMQISFYHREQQRGGFFPRVQLYASHSISHSSSDTTIDQRYDSSSVGIQLNYALYTGGYSRAAVRQANARYNQSKFDLEKSINDIVNNLHSYFDQCHHASQRLEAYQQAVRAAEVQVTATQKGIKAGQRTNMDLLNAEYQLYSTRLNLLNEQYQHMRAWLMLNYYSGQLTPEKLKVIAAYFSS